MKFDITLDVNMTKTTWSRLMKLNRLNVERYMNYSSKFECKIQRHVDFISDMKAVQHMLCQRHGTRQFGIQLLPNTLQYALGNSLQCGCDSLLKLLHGWKEESLF